MQIISDRLRPTALVTGASGFIGSHLAEELCARGYAVRCLLRQSSDPRWLQGLPVEIVRSELDDMPALQDATRGADYVFHVAGIVKALRSADYYTVNSVGTANVVRAVVETSPRLSRFLLVSSQAASGPATSFDKPASETNACRPISDYGKSKLQAEQLLRRTIDSLPFSVVRPAVVYGPRDTETLSLIKMADSHVGFLMGWRTRYVNLIYVKDLVRGIADCAESSQSVGRTYFLTHAQPYSWQTLFDVMSHVMGKTILRFHMPATIAYPGMLVSELCAHLRGIPTQFSRQKLREVMQLYWLCSPQSAREDFEFACRHTLPDGLHEAVAWYREHGWL